MVANTLNPRARTLAGALRQAREAHQPKISLNAHARNLGVSPSVVSYWETGRRIPSTEDVASFLTALGITGDQKDNILDLARGATEPDWLTVGVPGISHEFAGILECDRQATQITSWTLVIPGMLQTSAYARAVFAATDPAAEAKVALRMSRRDALVRRNPCHLTAIISELALRQVIGGTEVMLDQLRYLQQSADLATVTLQVVPIGEGWHPGLMGPFVLYGFPSAPSIVHLEHWSSAAFVYDAEDVATYQDAAVQLQQSAMSPAASLRLIADLTTEMETQ